MTSHLWRYRTLAEKIEILDAVKNSKPDETQRKMCKATGHWTNNVAKMAEGGKGIANRVRSSSARQRQKGAAIIEKVSNGEKQ